MIVIGIVNSIRRSSPTGGFIKKDRVSGRWISMSDEGAREKVGVSMYSSFSVAYCLCVSL